jgi:hypothetical protein
MGSAQPIKLQVLVSVRATNAMGLPDVGSFAFDVRCLDDRPPFLDLGLL